MRRQTGSARGLVLAGSYSPDRPTVLSRSVYRKARVGSPVRLSPRLTGRLRREDLEQATARAAAGQRVLMGGLLNTFLSPPLANVQPTSAWVGIALDRGATFGDRTVRDVGDIRGFPTADHFASYTGAAPRQASSGDRERHRLNTGGNRQLNFALHTIAVSQCP